MDLSRVAQDGMRVRANAGAASFRRAPTLEECVREAEEQVEQLKQEVEADPGAVSARARARRERAARERLERTKQALETARELQQRKRGQAAGQARASTTDADASVMKMGDGGFRPAFNVQLSTDAATPIVGVQVTNSGSDQDEALPMVEQLQERYGTTPNELLVDGGSVKFDDIEALYDQGIGV